MVSPSLGDDDGGRGWGSTWQEQGIARGSTCRLDRTRIDPRSPSRSSWLRNTVRSCAYLPCSRLRCLNPPFTLPPPDMRRDVQEIFRSTPHHKQVMMFSATLSKEIRVTCKKFMQSVSGTSALLTWTDVSPSRSTSTTRPSSPCTVCSSTSSSSRRRRRTASSTTCSTTSSSTRSANLIAHVSELTRRFASSSSRLRGQRSSTPCCRSATSRPSASTRACNSRSGESRLGQQHTCRDRAR